MSIEAMKQALEALDAITDDVDGTGLNTKMSFDKSLEAITSLRQAIEQAEKQEPRCAVIVEVFGKDWRLDYMSLPVGKHRLYTQEYVYTTPPAAQPLGYAHWEERIKDLMKQVGMPNSVSLAGAMNQLVNEMMQATPPAAQPTMFGPMGTVGALFDKHVIGRLDKNWRVYVEKNT